jgi:HAMP domain-containing protein
MSAEKAVVKLEMSPDGTSEDNRESRTELTREFVTATASKLVRRIDVRFGECELKRLATLVAATASNSHRRLNWPYRSGLGVKLLVWPGVLTALVGLAYGLSWLNLKVEVNSAVDFVQGLDALLGILVMLGAASWFFLTLGSRLVRSKLTKAVQELRALAHTVDLVQLDKDPDRLNWKSSEITALSPSLGKANTAFLLGRYLDYCAELLSLIGKIGALYSEQVTDTTVLGELAELEKLTNQYRDNIGTKMSLILNAHRNK